MEDLFDECNFMKTEGLNSLKKALAIADDYGVWQEFWINMPIEIAELYYENNICCICNGDERKIFYIKERGAFNG